MKLTTKRGSSGTCDTGNAILVSVPMVGNGEGNFCPSVGIPELSERGDVE